jgi:MGT family glycosyltransferase
VLPHFPKGEGQLVYVSFGSLGAMDTGFFDRLIAAFADVPARFLVNVGAQIDAYSNVPDNVHLQDWFPQPSVVAQCDLFIHHGGNNSFCEALYFGVPSLVMPYCWDGHDNAMRAVECGVGRMLGRLDWDAESLGHAIATLLADRAMQARLKENAAKMQAAEGVEQAARRILGVAARV